MAKFAAVDNIDGYYIFDCPGCECSHGVYTEGYKGGDMPIWGFNKDLDKPTVSPSIRVQHARHGNEVLCHSFVKEGNIQFLSDCTHSLAGKTVQLPEVN